MTVRTFYDAYSANEIADRKATNVVHKFGRHTSVGTTFAPIAIGGVYRTPQAASATKLRVKAGNANDTAAGSGARKICIVGLDATGAEITEELTTNGISAGTASTNEYMRLYRAFVAESGTYATQSAGSHSANIVIENSAGSEDWLTIDSTNFPRGQSEIAVFTIPANKEGYVLSANIYVDGSQEGDALLFQRTGILDAAAPYDAMRIVLNLEGITGAANVNPETPLGPFDELTDIGWMGRAQAGTASIAIDYEILLFNKN